MKASVSIAAVLGALELVGLFAATGMGLYRADSLDLTQIFFLNEYSWGGVVGGAFIAFFAYIGFETLANLAEEVENPQKTVPAAILASVVLSLILYIAVSISAVAGSATGDSPLASLFRGHSAAAFSVIVFFTISNGTLVQINMLSRLFYGMAHLGELPKVFATINEKTATPILTTAVATAIILITSVFLDFRALLTIVNYLTLVVFIAVDCALLKLKLSNEPTTAFQVPTFVPMAAAVLSIGMILNEAIVGFGLL